MQHRIWQSRNEGLPGQRRAFQPRRLMIAPAAAGCKRRFRRAPVEGLDRFPFTGNDPAATDVLGAITLLTQGYPTGLPF
jgi:hypothetical protein